MKTSATTQQHPSPITSILSFLETASALERRLDRILSSMKGISFSEYRLLSALAQANATGFPKVELANAVGLTPSAITRALKPLEKIGYIATQRNERDARHSLALITTQGRELLQDAQNILDDTLRELPINSLSPQKVLAFQQRLDEFKGVGKTPL